MRRKVVAVDGNGTMLERQPAPSARDSGGCFKGCQWHGCAVTKCRSDLFRNRLADPPWYWRLDERAARSA